MTSKMTGGDADGCGMFLVGVIMVMIIIGVAVGVMAVFS